MNSRKRFVTEVVEEHKKAIVVYTKKSIWLKLALQELKNKFSVYQTTESNQDYSRYDLAVFINVVPKKKELLKNCSQTIFIFRFFSKGYEEMKKWAGENLKKYKIVHLGEISKEPAEMVKFIFQQTPTPYIFNFGKKISPRPFIDRSQITVKSTSWFFLKASLSVLLLLNLLFFFFFGTEIVQLYLMVKQNPAQSKNLKNQVELLVKNKDLNEALFVVPKNTLFWLPGSDYLFSLFQNTQNTSVLIEKGNALLTNYSLLLQALLKKDKSEGEQKAVALRIKYLNKQIQEIDNRFFALLSGWKKTNLFFFESKKNQILTLAEQNANYLLLLKTLNQELPELIGSQTPKKYLLLFMNNMELRPGGGFIGSLGVVEFKNYSLVDFRVYDVYTLDGQLKTHLDPPEPIRKHLEQPHWFLRDSNFAPDFAKNSQTAAEFIKKEVGWTDFSGTVGVTFTAVQRILNLFPDFTVPGYKEKITADNFFIKAQSYAENQFFPGSHGKKNFLETVLRSLLAKLEEKSYSSTELAKEVASLFEEKFLVVYFENNSLQTVFDDLFWTGKLVQPNCSSSDKCFFDYFLVVDANVGMNKANFFVQRTIKLNTEIDNEGKVKNQAVIDYKNESTPGIYPGGVYKNYVQIYLPLNTQIKSLTLDGKKIINFDNQESLGFRRVGFLITIPEEQSQRVVLEYVFGQKFLRDEDYQLVVQKQIGSINNDFIFEMRLHNLTLSKSNFTPVVQRSGFVYNTFLQKDRILLIKFE